MDWLNQLAYIHEKNCVGLSMLIAVVQWYHQFNLGKNGFNVRTDFTGNIDTNGIL